MNLLLWGLSIIIYLFIGGIIANLLWYEWLNDTRTKYLPIWHKTLRIILFPELSYNWENRKSVAERRSYLLRANVTYDAYFTRYIFIWPLLRLCPILELARRFLLIYPIGGINATIFHLKHLVIALFNRKNNIQNNAFLQGKKKLISLNNSLAIKVRLLGDLISEGEDLAIILGTNGAAERCRALVLNLRTSLLRTLTTTKKAKDSLNSIEEEEKSFQNLSRLLEFYKKVANANEAGSTDITAVENAMAETLVACEKILTEISLEEVGLMDNGTPVEVLEAQIKDFAKERARLREAQEKIFAVR